MAGLSLIGVAALSLGFVQFKKNLSNPFSSFVPIGEEIAKASQILDNSQDVQALRNKDSDQDGLSDYEEIYIYHTNPYNKDSDGDSFTDQQEINSSNDPNCPVGKVCEKKINTPETPTIGSSEGASGGNTANISTNPLLQSNFDIASVPADTLRQYLRQSGVSEEALSSLDDATLKQLYAQAMSGEATDTKALENISSSESLDKIMSTIPASQIRSYLKDNGVPADIVDKLTDEELQQMLLKAGAQTTN